jgi:hypothetical protein
VATRRKGLGPKARTPRIPRAADVRDGEQVNPTHAQSQKAMRRGMALQKAPRRP